MSTARNRSTSIGSVQLATLAAAWDSDANLADVPVTLEPGRFLVAGLVLARVLDVKEVGDRAVAIVDRRHSHRSTPVAGGWWPSLRLLTAVERQLGDVIAAGPLCTGLDVFPESLA